MSARDDAVDHANHYRDAARLCVVELGPGVVVVTSTVAQAEALRAHLAELEPEAVAVPEPAEDTADSVPADGEAVKPPVRRGRPPKTTGHPATS